MRRAAVLLALATGACAQPFKFTDDAGVGGDGGNDAGVDAGVDAGCLATGECECERGADCPITRAVCTLDHRCVECLTASDCPGPRPLCDARTARCTNGCDAGAECDGGVRDRCGDDLPRHCVACDDLSCTGASTPLCVESVGFCLECARDSQCSSPRPYCDTRFGTCRECVGSTQCATDQFCHLATGTCLLR